MRTLRGLGAVAALLASVLACGAGGQVVTDGVRPDVSRAALEQPIVLQDVPDWRVTRHGPVDPAFTPRACSQIASLTTASFEGGTYTVQAGFSHNESLGATYTVPTAEWPIKIDLAECIFATSNATVQTTTIWAVSFYEGTPQTGTQVFSITSDDVILPHLRVGPGTAGVNVQFLVDPGDPEQVILQNNGSGQFSVVWTVVQHNQPSSNPCFIGPATCCNAFPVTDNTQCNNYTQLNHPTLNWLQGINCGPFGCPPNGGWARFSNLSAASACQNNGCRPRGDWVTRVTWSSVSCQPGVGACCFPDGHCEQMLQADCEAQTGTFQGDGTDCGAINCPQPMGACCTNNGTFCVQLSPTDCAGIPGGAFQGVGTQCNGNACPTGACCLANNSCVVANAVTCANQGGTFRGIGVLCTQGLCEPPRGACCFSNGFCTQLTESNCLGAGGAFRGVGVNCGPNSTCPQGGCCLPDGSCVVANAADCAAQGGAYRGDNTDCVGANCPAPTGACCFSNNFCLVMTQADCAGSGGTWAGVDTSCDDGNSNGTADDCETGPQCDSIDFNGDQLFPDNQDIEDFFSVFGGGPCSTGTCGDIDFNNDELFPDNTDIEVFLSVFGGGPCG
ncbi:MAG TPA: hypothetical protein VD971_04150 [Phycisphaerales bacterium]|nr:hypothetical protein [Phycisphaerales bacterium]